MISTTMKPSSPSHAPSAVAVIVTSGGMLSLEIDPKLAWALANPSAFPVDLNRAPRETLLRRVSLDLTGLPPTADECVDPQATIELEGALAGTLATDAAADPNPDGTVTVTWKGSTANAALTSAVNRRQASATDARPSHASSKWSIACPNSAYCAGYGATRPYSMASR